MVVVYPEQKPGQHGDTAENCREESVTVDGDFENPENGISNRRLSKNEEEIHGRKKLSRCGGWFDRAGLRVSRSEFHQSLFQVRDFFRRINRDNDVRGGRPASGVMLGVIGGLREPKKRPDRVQRKKAHRPAGMDGFLMRIISRLGEVIRNVVNRNHPVSQYEDHKKYDREGEVAEKVRKRR